MHTEEEARKRWCPFSRTVEKLSNGVTAARNRVVLVSDDSDDGQSLAATLIGCKCIASECMAWRISGEHPVVDDTASFGDPLKYKGYCGLSGTP
jgi:hypothetical protein